MKLPLQDYLDALHAQWAPCRDGEVATYIPELATVDADGFGICIATTDGHVYASGDAERLFTVQSISKPFVYAAALADRGLEALRRKIGVEPSGDAFNSISLDPATGAPLNPMINAGAIAATALVDGVDAAAQWARIEQALAAFAGRRLDLDEAVYRSESETGFRNRAIAWMLRNFGIVEGDPMPALENYFRQCSLRVDCHDLALMAATLANAGVHPRSGRRALATEQVAPVLSVMASCGMYDYSGNWLYEVGMPAKSGVGGGILAVLPGRLGIGVYSPRLDPRGNSVRGVAVCRQISRDFGLHVFGASHRPELVLHSVRSGRDAPSRRERSVADAKWLHEQGAAICTLALQGEVGFDGAEHVTRRIAALQADSRFFIVDLRRASGLARSAARLLHEMRARLAADGRMLVFAGVARDGPVASALQHRAAGTDHRYLSFADAELAAEWCEQQLLAQASDRPPAGPLGSLADLPLFAGLPAAGLQALDAAMDRADFAAGEAVFEAGAEDDRLFLVLEGELSVLLPVAGGRLQRLSTIGAGACFGEMVLLGYRTRSASVHADSAVHCRVLSARRFDELAAEWPDLRLRVVENLARSTAERLRKLNAVISTLAS
jgi:glutaminase